MNSEPRSNFVERVRKGLLMGIGFAVLACVILFFRYFTVGARITLPEGINFDHFASSESGPRVRVPTQKGEGILARKVSEHMVEGQPKDVTVMIFPSDPKEPESLGEDDYYTDDRYIVTPIKMMPTMTVSVESADHAFEIDQWHDKTDEHGPSGEAIYRFQILPVAAKDHRVTVKINSGTQTEVALDSVISVEPNKWWRVRRLAAQDNPWIVAAFLFGALIGIAIPPGKKTT
jgi:hypothetical protein